MIVDSTLREILYEPVSACEPSTLRTPEAPQRRSERQGRPDRPWAWSWCGRVIAAWALAAGFLACARVPLPPPANACTLWDIVSTCVDRDAIGVCACPAFACSCCGDRATPDADVVWARTQRFVAIRDLQMCGCPPGFVHGLALPRARVTGIEDPHRPEAIWPFAWDVARSRIPDERQIGLVINPEVARSQNQMHVHLLRLRPETRSWLDASDGAVPTGVTVLPLPNLDAVFANAEARVGAARMAYTGILVARAREGVWRAVLTDRSSPEAFTVRRCQRDAVAAPASLDRLQRQVAQRYCPAQDKAWHAASLFPPFGS
jgi:CDP-diacylglycerol pyrophosphatase